MIKNKPNRVVPFSLFHLSCGGLFINDGKVLLIQEKAVYSILGRGNLKGNSVFLEEGLMKVKLSNNAWREKSESNWGFKVNFKVYFG